MANRQTTVHEQLKVSTKFQAGGCKRLAMRRPNAGGPLGKFHLVPAKPKRSSSHKTDKGVRTRDKTHKAVTPTAREFLTHVHPASASEPSQVTRSTRTLLRARKSALSNPPAAAANHLLCHLLVGWMLVVTSRKTFSLPAENFSSGRAKSGGEISDPPAPEQAPFALSSGFFRKSEPPPPTISLLGNLPPSAGLN